MTFIPSGAVTKAEDLEVNDDILQLGVDNAQDALDKLSDSKNIKFDNTGSGLSATNVEGAIKELVSTSAQVATMPTVTGEFLDAGDPVFTLTKKEYLANLTDSKSYVTFESSLTAGSTKVIKISNNRLLMIYSRNSQGRGKVYNMLTNESGEEFVFTTNNVGSLDAIEVENNKILIVFRDLGFSNFGQAKVIEIDGLELDVLGSDVLFNGLDTNWLSIANVVDDRYIVVYRGSDTNAKARLIDIDLNDNSLSIENEVQILGAASTYNVVKKLENNKLLFQCRESTTTVTARILSISGTTITPGTPFGVATTGTPDYPHFDLISPTQAVSVYTSGSRINGRVLSISGATIGGGSGFNLSSSTTTYWNEVQVISPTRAIAVFGWNSPSGFHSAEMSISGTTLTLENNVQVATDNSTLNQSFVWGNGYGYLLHNSEGLRRVLDSSTVQAGVGYLQSSTFPKLLGMPHQSGVKGIFKLKENLFLFGGSTQTPEGMLHYLHFEGNNYTVTPFFISPNTNDRMAGNSNWAACTVADGIVAISTISRSGASDIRRCTLYNYGDKGIAHSSSTSTTFVVFNSSQFTTDESIPLVGKFKNGNCYFMTHSAGNPTIRAIYQPKNAQLLSDSASWLNGGTSTGGLTTLNTTTVVHSTVVGQQVGDDENRSTFVYPLASSIRAMWVLSTGVSITSGSLADLSTGTNPIIRKLQRIGDRKYIVFYNLSAEVILRAAVYEINTAGTSATWGAPVQLESSATGSLACMIDNEYGLTTYRTCFKVEGLTVNILSQNSQTPPAEWSGVALAGQQKTTGDVEMFSEGLAIFYRASGSGPGPNYCHFMTVENNQRKLIGHFNQDAFIGVASSSVVGSADVIVNGVYQSPEPVEAGKRVYKNGIWVGNAVTNTQIKL